MQRMMTQVHNPNSSVEDSKGVPGSKLPSDTAPDNAAIWGVSPQMKDLLSVYVYIDVYICMCVCVYIHMSTSFL